MHHSNFDKKVRFSYLLPYGVISPLALELSMEADPYERVEYDPNITMEERIARCDRAHKKRVDALYDMGRYGYVETVVRKIGKGHSEKIRVCRLTRSGLYVITETPDDKLEEQRLAKAGQKATLYQEGSSYLDCSDAAVADRYSLYALGKKKEDDPAAMERFVSRCHEKVTEKNSSILIREIAKAPDIALNSEIKAERLYRHWRMANVNAFFIANHFLTTLDKTPMAYANPVRDIHDKDDETPLDLKTFVDYTLGKWYDEYQFSLTYENPAENESSEVINRWYRKPVFYPFDCIPGFEPSCPDDEFRMVIKNMNNKARTFIGLAAGVRANYIVYHTRPDRFEWNKGMEMDTIDAVHNALKKAHEKEMNPHAGNPTEYAMFFCPNIRQFKRMFDVSKIKMKKKVGDNRNVNKPYDGIYIIPFNHSGAYQFRNLMQMNPIALEDALVYKFLKNYDGFTKTYSSTFPLSYKKTPVLLAHTMNFQHLFEAMEAYEKGEKFYVSCYPGQVKFIQQIMPNVEFL